MRLQYPEIEQTAVKAAADVDSLVIIKVFCGLPEHHAEDAEQSWCQETTLFHAVGDGKGFREVAVQCDLSAVVFVQLSDHAEEFWGETETLQDQPESLPAHSVERYGQVDKRYIQLLVLLPTLLLKLPEDEDHDCGAPVSLKPH